MSQVMVNECSRAIIAAKKRLIAQWKRYGNKENFGRNEVRRLRDEWESFCNPYVGWGRDISTMLAHFSDWCENYTGDGKL